MPFVLFNSKKGSSFSFIFQVPAPQALIFRNSGTIVDCQTAWHGLNEPGKANLTTGPLSLTSQHGLGQTHIWAKTISPLRRAESSWQSLKSLSSYVKRK